MIVGRCRGNYRLEIMQMRKLDEQREATRGKLALRGLAVLTVYAILLIPTLAFAERLGISPSTIQTLVTIFRLLVTLQATAFAHYFLRR